MTNTDTQPLYGDVRAVDAREYGYPDGWLVECYGWYGDREMWAIPAWEERGCADLVGPFASREEAQKAIAAEWWTR